VARTRELALVAVRLAGPGCVQPLTAVSRATAQSLGGLSHELSAHFPLAVYAVGGAAPSGPLASVERFSPTVADAAEPAAPLAAPRAVCAAVAVGGQVYAIAGRGADGSVLGSVERFDPRLNAWQTAPPLRRARGWVAATAVGGSICVLGGDGTDVEGYDLTLDVAEQLDPRDGAWAPLPSMGCPRWAAAAAAVGNHVYVAGGHFDNGRAVLGDVERLELRSACWEPLHPLRCPRAAFALAAVGGKLYAVGGYDRQERGLRSLERFDPQRGVWEVLAAMGNPRWGLSALACGGSLYVMGGSAGSGDAAMNVSTIKRFDPDAGTWEPAGRLLTPRRCCGVAACR